MLMHLNAEAEKYLNHTQRVQAGASGPSGGDPTPDGGSGSASRAEAAWERRSAPKRVRRNHNPGWDAPFLSCGYAIDVSAP